MSADLITFGEALLTYKPQPATPGEANDGGLPLAKPATRVVQAVGGAELNVAVAFANISKKSGKKASSWVSILPAGPLGDHVIDAAQAANVAISSVKVIDTPNATIGTLHVVDDGKGPRPQYQRHHSAFCSQIGSTTFAWPLLLSGARWLHVTGITPQLNSGARGAWSAALEAAAAANAKLNMTVPHERLHVSLDLNHRPALGTLESLWSMVKPHLFNVSLLMLSEDSLQKLAMLEGVWAMEEEEEEQQEQEEGRGGGAWAPPPRDLLHKAQVAALRSLRTRWRCAMLGCCFKRPLGGGSGAAATAAPAGNKNTLMGGRGVRRWSVVAFDGGEATTEGMHVEHAPLEALGGGDAWTAGFLHAMAEAPGRAAEPPIDANLLQRACRRGDLLAALAMASYGDLSDVGRDALMAAEAQWRGKPASLLPLLPTPAPAPAPAQPTAVADHSATLGRLGRCRLVPVVSIDEPADAEPVARALLAGGLDVMELVLRTPAAEEALRIIASRVGEMLVGAGTVLSPEQAERAVNAGARFLVAPGTNPRVCKWARERGVLMVPGVATASEIETAMEMGLTNLKFFPAEANGGAKTLKALSAPYSAVKWMPTGGVTEAIMPNYLALKSVFAVGGSWLVPAKALASKDYEAITALTRAALEAVRSS